MDLPIDEMSKKGIAPPYVPEMQKKKKRKVSFVRCKDILTKKKFLSLYRLEKYYPSIIFFRKEIVTYNVWENEIFINNL